jgi:hypothetical protein
MSFSIFMPYRPFPGEVVPIETDLVHAVRREAKDDRFITWRESTGWVLSYKDDDGRVVDVAFLGSGEMPVATRGTIESAVSFLTAARCPRENAEKAKKETEEKERNKLRALEEKQGAELEFKKFLRHRVKPHFSDHPSIGAGR